ncbi:DUF294 nucleotidyltransferase-like domain-containing protein [Rossellomorea aquimaris]|uniref:DUF294 nucleotidyltransferase-like domain-containing protein n=1 Tax=Rossellomorea aquimaris TaxID=189382 RepID=UPI001CD2DEC9|nr:DUF294 nucleotidyltransferase-like domain-containing protein [Rossellomorea aquimaris]MCA1055128.1 DUF294 nucleotidyltransferase-like domain-containing protein [Rossellomorea aquimaris]
MSTSKPDQHFQEAVLLHPFFSGMERGTALSLLSGCQKVTPVAGQTVLKSDETRRGLYLVVVGEVEVMFMDREVLEIIPTGGVVGLSSLYSFMEKETGLYASVEVKAKEDSLLCLVPFSGLNEFRDDSPLNRFLLTETSKRLQDIYHSLSNQVGASYRVQERSTILKRVKDIMVEDIITIGSGDSIQEAAALMGKNRVSSVVVVDDGTISGILTERDLVSRCIAGGIALNSPVKDGMTASPVVIGQEAYLYEALAAMLDHSIKHLPVTDQGRLTGIITLYDVMKANHTGALTSAKKIEDPSFPLIKIKTAFESVFQQLWKAQAPVDHVLGFITSLVDRLVRRVLKEAEAELLDEGRDKPCSYAFYMMGSAGRKEQFLLTDQDHFLVYEARDKESEDYFEVFAEKVVRKLEQAGMSRCDGGMMSNHPEWRGSLETWEEKVRKWGVRSSEETLMMSQNFFSFRLLGGDDTLHESFLALLHRQWKGSKILFVRMAQAEKTKPAPVLHSSIRSLLGMQRKAFSIKKEILFPFHHALQLLNLAHGNLSGSTLEKIEFLVKKGSLSPLFGEELIEAFEEIMKLNMEMKQSHQGYVVQLAALSTREKESLYHNVKTIREFQHMMLSHFSLS